VSQVVTRASKEAQSSISAKFQIKCNSRNIGVDITCIAQSQHEKKLKRRQ